MNLRRTLYNLRAAYQVQTCSSMSTDPSSTSTSSILPSSDAYPRRKMDTSGNMILKQVCVSVTNSDEEIPGCACLT